MDPMTHCDLPSLLRQVVSARGALERVRVASPHARMSTQDARAHLLHALEEYADGLESENCPVPYKLRDELRLQRRLVGT